MEPSRRWQAAWALGGTVVVVVAGLLVTIIWLARRIAGQAAEIEDAINGARRNAAPLFDLSAVNLALDRVARQFPTVRESA